MKPTTVLLLLALVLFVGYVVYGSLSRVTARCEVCLEFDGRLVCRSGAGATVEEARAAAQESVCGGNARGMDETMACRNRAPVRQQCTTG